MREMLDREVVTTDMEVVRGLRDMMEEATERGLVRTIGLGGEGNRLP